jgi:hypothetical protein
VKSHFCGPKFEPRPDFESSRCADPESGLRFPPRGMRTFRCFASRWCCWGVILQRFHLVGLKYSKVPRCTPGHPGVPRDTPGHAGVPGHPVVPRGTRGTPRYPGAPRWPKILNLGAPSHVTAAHSLSCVVAPRRASDRRVVRKACSQTFFGFCSARSLNSASASNRAFRGLPSALQRL